MSPDEAELLLSHLMRAAPQSEMLESKEIPVCRERVPCTIESALARFVFVRVLGFSLPDECFM